MKQWREGSGCASAYRLAALLALATGLLIPVAPASAQTASACVTAACTSTQQSYPGQLPSGRYRR